MTIPSRPAPPPPTNSLSRAGSSSSSSSSQQQYHNGGVTINNIAIKLPPPPAAKNFQLNLTSNYSSLSATQPISTNNNNTNNSKSITRHFPIAKTRYAPATNWNGSPFDSSSSIQHTTNQNQDLFGINKKIPPPRPPPPRVATPIHINGVLKKPGPPQSVNVLSNLFGRKKSTNNNTATNSTNSQKKLPSKSTQLLTYNNDSNNKLTTYQTNSSYINKNSTLFFETSYQNSNNGGTVSDVQLITFDSPPSSPTFTQKSNSDCVSVDSFSSDSNFSSPNNGNVSQPESGFEDDFSTTITSPPDPWETMQYPYSEINNGARSSNYMIINDLKVSHPVRNMNVINKIQTENHLCNGKSLLPPQSTLSVPTIIRPKGQKSTAPKPPIILPKPNISSGHQTVQTRTNLMNNLSYDDDPPMPNCPPPPPPSNLNTEYQQFLNENIDEDGPAYGISLYAFDGAEIGDLSFRENEKIYLIKKLNDEWFMGRTKSGCEGIFPSNYIDIKVKLNDEKELAHNSNMDNNNSLKSKSLNQYQTKKIKVLYNFNAEQPDDLTIQENDLVTPLYKINDEWLFGELYNKRGQFPANFIEYVPHDLPYEMP